MSRDCILNNTKYWLFIFFEITESVHMNVENRNNNNIAIIVLRERLFVGKERQTDRCSRPSCGCDKSIA